MANPWEEQFERVKRYYRRFGQLNEGTIHNAPSEERFDDVLAFFQNCYHLKDYLKNDQSYNNHNNDEIEAYVRNTRALAICADICNATKHLILINPPRSGDVPKFGGRNIKL